MSDTKRLLALDGLRGLAALCIVLFHYASGYEWPTYHPFYYFQYLEEAVQVFFIISGFFILISIKRIHRSLDFIVARCARLFPVYWISLITTLLITNVFQIIGSRTQETYDIVLNFTMLQEFFGATNVNIVYWTLTVELAFYLVILIFYRIRIIRHIDILCGIWLGLILIDTGRGLGLLGGLPENTTVMTAFQPESIHELGSAITFTSDSPSMLLAQVSESTDWLSAVKDFVKNNFLLLRGRASLFLSGIFLYQLHTWGGNWYRILAVILCILVEAFDYSPDTPKYAFIFFMVFVAAVYLSILDKIPFLNSRLLVFLGSISYSLYLMHLQVRWLTNSWLRGLPPELTILLQTVLAIALSYWLTTVVEFPAMRSIRSYYRARLS